MSIFKKLFSKDNKQSESSTEFSEGDIFYTFSNGQYHIYKLLVFDKDFDCYHVLSYGPINTLPNKNDIDGFKVYIYHSPIAKGGFQEPVFIVNKKVVANDLIGYHEYLRQTQEAEYYFTIANDYYLAGLALTDQGKHIEAIDSYAKAFDLVPTFFEAIDNQAFCKMDIGLWQEAIEGFRKSLEVNPNSLLAEFSIGECYLKLEEYQKAKEQFQKAISIDPTNQIAKDFLKKTEDLIASS